MVKREDMIKKMAARLYNDFSLKFPTHLKAYEAAIEYYKDMSNLEITDFSETDDVVGMYMDKMHPKETEREQLVNTAGDIVEAKLNTQKEILKNKYDFTSKPKPKTDITDDMWGYLYKTEDLESDKGENLVYNDRGGLWKPGDGSRKFTKNGKLIMNSFEGDGPREAPKEIEEVLTEDMFEDLVEKEVKLILDDIKRRKQLTVSPYGPATITNDYFTQYPEKYEVPEGKPLPTEDFATVKDPVIKNLIAKRARAWIKRYKGD